jgi:hypothetical protein
MTFCKVAGSDEKSLCCYMAAFAPAAARAPGAARLLSADGKAVWAAHCLFSQAWCCSDHRDEDWQCGMRARSPAAAPAGPLVRGGGRDAAMAAVGIQFGHADVSIPRVLPGATWLPH